MVTVRSLPDRKLVAKLHPKEGRFRVEVRPGAYRVRAFIRDGGYCWEGEAKDVKVAKDQTTGVRLRVYNSCIVLLADAPPGAQASAPNMLRRRPHVVPVAPRVDQRTSTPQVAAGAV